MENSEIPPDRLQPIINTCLYYLLVTDVIHNCSPHQLGSVDLYMALQLLLVVINKGQWSPADLDLEASCMKFRHGPQRISEIPTPFQALNSLQVHLAKFDLWSQTESHLWTHWAALYTLTTYDQELQLEFEKQYLSKLGACKSLKDLVLLVISYLQSTTIGCLEHLTTETHLYIKTDLRLIQNQL